ncbi:unnamed protein product [Trichobilharzia regenti]|nr:unnamed protein product [Trichobilharzia regenti]
MNSTHEIFNNSNINNNNNHSDITIYPMRNIISNNFNKDVLKNTYDDQSSIDLSTAESLQSYLMMNTVLWNSLNNLEQFKQQHQHQHQHPHPHQHQQRQRQQHQRLHSNTNEYSIANMNSHYYNHQQQEQQQQTNGNPVTDFTTNYNIKKRKISDEYHQSTSYNLNEMKQYQNQQVNDTMNSSYAGSSSHMEQTDETTASTKSIIMSMGM